MAVRFLGDGQGGFEGGAARGAGVLHQVLEEGEMILVDGAGGGVVTDAYPCGFADDFAHHAAGAHDPDGAEAIVGDADIAAGHE